MPDRTDYRVSPLLRIKEGAWKALEALTIDSITIAGRQIELDAPVALQPGQRLVIEWHGGSEATFSFYTPD